MIQKIRGVFNLSENGRLGRFTFWTVLFQGILVIVLLALSLVSVARQAARAEAQLVTNEELISQNYELIAELRENQTGQRFAMVDAMFCMLRVEPQDRTDEIVEGCLNLFVQSELLEIYKHDHPPVTFPRD